MSDTQAPEWARLGNPKLSGYWWPCGRHIECSIAIALRVVTGWPISGSRQPT